MKRSTTATLLLMGIAPLMLSACDDPQPKIQSQAFKTVADCTSAGNTPAECDTAFRQAQMRADGAAPHYSSLADFMISHMLGSSSPSYYGAAPLYTQSNGQYYASPTSRGSFGSIVTTSAGSDAGSRAITASRGGFGSESAARGGWGG
jgi:uncharacterized protein YgiB involved in biofilm formation